MGIGELERALAGTIKDFLLRDLPLRRISLVGSLLKFSRTSFPDETELVSRLQMEQKPDGGWIDCEDTAWNAYFLSGRRDFVSHVDRALTWLVSERCPQKGWGFCKRDRSCIPITSQILFFLPQISGFPESASWLEEEWRKDLAAPVKLSYKAAFFILTYVSAQNRNFPLSPDLFQRTVEYLVAQQRDDGSWGPWRDHPAPSECFISGLCLGALAVSQGLIESRKFVAPALERGCQWAHRNQLDNGFFPAHFIDEGSAWVLFGWKEAEYTLAGNRK